MTVDRRRHERVPIRVEVQLVQNGRTEEMTLRDLSVGGAFLETTLYDHIDWKTGSHCTLTLFVDEDTPAHPAEEGHTIHAHARIVRRDPGGHSHPSGLGIEFEHLDPENLNRLCVLMQRTP